jgi:hypothetical protein
VETRWIGARQVPKADETWFVLVPDSATHANVIGGRQKRQTQTVVGTASANSSFPPQLTFSCHIISSCSKQEVRRQYLSEEVSSPNFQHLSAITTSGSIYRTAAYTIDSRVLERSSFSPHQSYPPARRMFPPWHAADLLPSPSSQLRQLLWPMRTFFRQNKPTRRLHPIIWFP